MRSVMEWVVFVVRILKEGVGIKASSIRLSERARQRMSFHLLLTEQVCKGALLRRWSTNRGFDAHGNP